MCKSGVKLCINNFEDMYFLHYVVDIKNMFRRSQDMCRNSTLWGAIQLLLVLLHRIIYASKRKEARKIKLTK